MIASQEGKFDAVKFLVENDADIHRTNFENLTALDFAVWKEYKEIVEYLVIKGAKKNRQITKNIQTGDIASFTENDAIIDLFYKEYKHPVKKADMLVGFFREKLNFATKDIPNEIFGRRR